MATENLTKEEVLHLAKLARLELTPQEVELYTHQLGEVLRYVAKLQELKVPTGAGVREPVVLRADQVEPWPDPAELIHEAPKHTDTHIEVPAVFENR